MKKPVSNAMLGLILGTALAAAGSTPSWAEDTVDHAAHHPAATQDAPPPAKDADSKMGMDQKASPGMMGGDMMSGMMGGESRMAMMSGMMSSHMEGRLAFLKTELKITSAQTPQWNRFADSYRAAGQLMKTMHGSMTGMMQANLPSRLALHQKMLSARLDAMNAIAGPLNALYAVLNNDQKKSADELLGMGGMGGM